MVDSLFGNIIYRWHLRKSDLPRYIEIPIVLAIARENEMAKRLTVYRYLPGYRHV